MNPAGPGATSLHRTPPCLDHPSFLSKAGRMPAPDGGGTLRKRLPGCKSPHQTHALGRAHKQPYQKALLTGAHTHTHTPHSYTVALRTHSHIRMVSLLPLTPRPAVCIHLFLPEYLQTTLCAREKPRDALTRGSHWLAENPLNSPKTRPGSTFCSSAWGPVSCRDTEGALPSAPRLSHRQLSSSSRPTCTHSCGSVSLLNKSSSLSSW